MFLPVLQDPVAPTSLESSTGTVADVGDTQLLFFFLQAKNNWLAPPENREFATLEVNFTHLVCFQNLRSRIRRIHVAGRPVPNTVDLTRLETELKLRLAAQSAIQLEEGFHDDGRLHVGQVLLKAGSRYNTVNENNIFEFFAFSEEFLPRLSRKYLFQRIKTCNAINWQRVAVICLYCWLGHWFMLFALGLCMLCAVGGLLGGSAPGGWGGGGLLQGCLLRRRGVSASTGGEVCGIPACTEADPPHPRGQNHRRL